MQKRGKEKKSGDFSADANARSCIWPVQGHWSNWKQQPTDVYGCVHVGIIIWMGYCVTDTAVHKCNV